MTDRIMTPKHPDWREFAGRLAMELNGGEWADTCDGTRNRPRARSILAEQFPEIDIDATMQYFDANDGYCDCEILLNVQVW